jgi:hypothetical protein
MNSNVTPDKIVTFCLHILKKYALHEIEASVDEANPDVYFIQNKKPALTLYRKSAHSRDVPAIALKNGFLLHLGIAFERIDRTKPKTGYKFKGISLQLFKDHSLLFRAEWDNKSDRETIHPQPHWHIEPMAVFNGKEIDKEIQHTFEELLDENQHGFLNYLERDALKKEKVFSYEKFHFAMSSKWHKNEPACNIPFTEQNLNYWLENCLSSIDQQLKYVSK